MAKSARTKVALVTGASSGIGQATAVELARRGHAVAIHYFRNEQGARDTFDSIRTVPNGRARVYACDLCDPAAINRLAGEVLADFERIDALVNNVGSLVARKSLAEMDYDLWRKVFAVNLDSAFLITRAFLPCMLKQGKGDIVNVTSLAGRTGGTPGGAAYAAAKGALITLTKAMAREFISQGIRVNCVSPGIIDTPFHDRFGSGEILKKSLPAIPRKRFGNCEEIAKAIAFLLSKDAEYIVGECMEINGGLLMD